MDVQQVVGTVTDPAQIKAAFRTNDWNECTILAQGNRLVHSLNGMVVAELTDENAAKRHDAGTFAFMVYNWGTETVEAHFKDMRVRELAP